MKPTENYEQLLKRFNKRITQVDPEDKERISYFLSQRKFLSSWIDEKEPWVSKSSLYRMYFISF